MKQVWKYELSPDCVHEVPAGGKVLSAAQQGDDINLWILVNPEANKETRRFRVFPTGIDIEESPESELRFIQTVMLNGGNLVFHVFEEVPVKNIKDLKGVQNG